MEHNDGYSSSQLQQKLAHFFILSIDLFTKLNNIETFYFVICFILSLPIRAFSDFKDNSNSC